MLKIPFAIRSGVIVAVVVSVACPAARATLNVRGDVTTLPTYEIITPSEYDSEVTTQTTWEQAKDIVVGVKLLQGGRLEIDGTTEVRYQQLIIGSKGLQAGIERKGSGSVLITGDGALYSNDPLAIPPQYSSITSAAPRSPTVGFDVIVGEWGQGRLDIRGEGRAEIQDAVVVGDNPGSSGVLTVTGAGSMLGHGGFGTNNFPQPHQMIVGRQGTGQMFITDGGLVVSEALSVIPTGDIVGAVIGSNPYDEGAGNYTSIPELGGFGEVTLTGLSSNPQPGLSSRWVIGGSLQVGGFHLRVSGSTPEQLLSGSNVNYNGTNGQPGRGTLIVETNSVVKVRNSLGVPSTSTNQELRLMVGRFGTVDLRGGIIEVGDGVTPQDSTPDEVELINDGLIKGYGRIRTGVFRNRYYGQVRVSQGQSLVIDSTSEFQNPLTDNYPLYNFGLIEVLGTEDQPAELEFVRPPAVAPPGIPDGPLTPFVNRPVETTAPTTFDGGLISAQHATLRFHSGIQNEGSMIFSDGVNRVSGRVDNITGLVNRNALVYIGPDTTVVADNDFSSGAFVPGAGPGAPPILSLQGGSTLIVEGDLAFAGFLDMELSLTNPSTIQVAGDLGVNATLFASFDSEAMSLLSHGDAFELMYFAREIGSVDFTDPVRLSPDLATNPILNVATDANFDALFPTLDLIAMPVLQSYYLFVRDPALVGDVGAMGADFDGDGFVTAADLAIWQMFKGITSGASVLQGDADGDGDVDGADYLIWLNKFTTTGVPGGSPAPSGNVPEPAGLALISIGAVLAQTYRRRRG